jgi:heme/flavin dehydrogenase (mycofactocin system)
VARGWFESVAIARDRARRRLPSSVFGALVAGAEKGVSARANEGSFDPISFAPRLANLPQSRDLSRTFMGMGLSMPVVISPTGVQAVHPDGEVAVARAAAARGIAMGLSSFASKPLHEVVAANPDTMFQVYWLGGRDALLERLELARSAGAKGLILTLDWSFSHGRDWGSPWIPERIDLRSAVRLAPQALSRPAWLWSFVRAGRLPDLTAPNMARTGSPPPTFFGAYGEWMQTPPPTWDDVAWLRSQWDGPFMVKGVCRVDDARRVVDLGATALSVSNHGGNNLDGTPSPIRALAAVVDAVGDHIEVAMDGGVRRGSDVVKALCLGARAVMIGRAYLWGLAANGQAGVENVLDVLRGGIDSTMRALGHANVDELSRGDVLLPEGFSLTLGADVPRAGRRTSSKTSSVRRSSTSTKGRNT